MEVHLDLVGGLAGDMFIAALLDAFPRLEPEVMGAIRQAGGASRVFCELVPHHDAVLRGRRFKVRLLEDATPDLAPAGARRHEHIRWRDIRTRLEESALDAEVRRHALGIFELLAEAEASVHGLKPDEVEFHEVGAWDSIADVAGAAALIAALGARRWTASPAPLGCGRVATAHGVLPVPAPATVHLLTGLPTLDDGVAGERVTPTGAAILRYLCGTAQARPAAAQVRPRVLAASGTGFGARRLPGISNHLRVLCFKAPERAAPASHRRLHVVEFEIDDQSGEELAVGLERIRAQDGVLDVTQSAVFGKKGRMMTHVQVLVRDDALDCAVEMCFRQTTTIGLRHRTVSGVALERRSLRALVDGEPIGVKLVERPGGRTAKAESDHVAPRADHAARARTRRRAEQKALEAAFTEAERA